MASGQTYQSLFNYGETGTALDGFRDSDISKQSANKLVNFYISEMGTLQVAHKYDRRNVTGLGEQTVKNIKVTRYDFILVLTETKIVSIDKYTHKTLYELTYIDNKEKENFDEFCNCNIFQEYLFIKLKNGLPKIFSYDSQGRIGELDFFSQIKLPYKFSKEVVADLYQVYKQEDKMIPQIMTVYKGNLNLKMKPNGDVYLAGVNLKVDRIYVNYKTVVSESVISDMTEGMRFLVFRTYNPTIKESKLGYYVNGYMLNWDQNYKVYDKKYGGDYYTKIYAVGSNNIVNGELTYGMKEDFINDRTKLIDFCEFQSRLVIATKDKLYFSKVLDITDFSVGLGADSGFFLKLSTIEGNQSDILKLVSGNGIYVISTEGIYVVSYGQTIRSTNQSVRIASTTNPLPICVLIDDILYYLDNTGILRAIIPSFESGFVQFSNVTVDKYSNEKFIYSFLTKCTINNRNCLVITYRKKKDEMRVIEYVGDNIFRRSTIEIKNNYIIHGIGSDIIIGNDYLAETQRNMEHAQLILNLPFIQTQIGGVYLNDFQQEYNQIVINVLNIDSKYIKGITINKYPIQNIQYNVKNYNIYRFTGTLPIMNLTIDLYLNNYDKEEGDDIVEIRGINCWLK